MLKTKTYHLSRIKTDSSECNGDYGTDRKQGLTQFVHEKCIIFVILSVNVLIRTKMQH